ncbi:MAG: putative aminohydrolase SsnA [Verrucomicrobia bacterium]|nr:putative aminohydrolase SsnA [Kiritimatiellia bacterium]MCO6400886.1 putative aminohydrolase SsnA [Verrucomicrobiota bacterium]
MNRLLIKNGTLVTLDDAGTIIENGSLLIEGSKIAAVGAVPDVPVERVVDAGGGVVMPGLINVHHHFYSTLARGFSAPGVPAANFKEILERLWWKLDRALDAEDVYSSSIIPCIEAIRAGCTTIIDHHASPACADGSLDILERAFREAGLNGSLCYEVSDRNAVGEGIEENVRFAKKCRREGDTQIQPLFGLHASMTLGPATLERCAAEGKALGVGFHVHIDEAECDAEESLRQFGALPIDRFQQAGIVGRKSLFAHGIHLDERGRNILADSDSMMATNPESNANNGLSATPLLEIMRTGILIGLGTDGMSNQMISQARAAYLVQRATRRDPRVAFGEACAMLLSNNRRICDRVFPEKRGQLMEGQLADIAIFDYQPFTPMRATNFYGHLLFGLVQAPVTTTICRGRVLLEGGKIPHLDEVGLRRQAVERARRLWERIR